MTEVRVTPEPPDSPVARALLDRYYAELAARFHDGFDLARTVAAPPAELTPPHGRFLLARIDTQVLGCGAVRLLDGDRAEIKRMWVAPTARGLGIGRAVLAALESAAGELGARTVRLDTAAELTEALALYQSSGYREIAPYNDNPYAAHWLEKRVA